MYIRYMENYVPCRFCKNLPGPKQGFIYTSIKQTSKQITAIKECDCHKAYRERKLYSIRAKKSDIWDNPPDLRNTYLGSKSIEDKERFEKYVDEFSSFKNNIVYLYGPNGTQKTSAAMWAGLELIKKGYKVQYTLMYKLISLLTSSFEKKEEAEVILQTYRSADLLIVDESFTKDKVLLYKSGYQLPFLDSFIRERIDVYKKGTLFVSNKHISEIKNEGFGQSIQDLIARNARNSSLEFLDNYVASDVNNFSAGSIFD